MEWYTDPTLQSAIRFGRLRLASYYWYAGALYILLPVDVGREGWNLVIRGVQYALIVWMALIVAWAMFDIVLLCAATVYFRRQKQADLH